MNRQRNGFTLIELMMVVAIMSLVIIGMVRFFSTTTPLIKRTQVRQDVVTGGRGAMDTMLLALRSAKARTLVITTPGGPTSSPNSRVDFNLVAPSAGGATAYAIYLANRTIFIQENRPVGGWSTAKPLATNVTLLSFTGDYRDPTTLSVSLRIDAPWDGSGDPTHMTSLLLANQVVHLVDAP